MTRLALALTLLGVLALSAFAVTETASAHENCIHTTEHNWQVTGCVSPDGSVVWTAVDPLDNFYRWVNGKWQEQERPPVPEPVVLPPLRNDAPAILGLPTFGKRDSGRIEYGHEVLSDDEHLYTVVAVRGASDNRHFPLGLIKIGCLYPSSFMSITLSAYLPILDKKYYAWLDPEEDTQVSFSTRLHRWQDVKLDTHNKSTSISSHPGDNTRSWHTYNEAQEFFPRVDETRPAGCALTWDRRADHRHL